MTYNVFSGTLLYLYLYRIQIRMCSEPTIIFSTSISITQIELCTIYFHSTDGDTALLSDYGAAFSETMQQPWWSLNSLSTSCYTDTYFAEKKTDANVKRSEGERTTVVV